MDGVEAVVGEIMRLHRSLPARPAVEEVEAAAALARGVEREERARLEAIARRPRPAGVPDELFRVAQEMQCGLVRFQCSEERRDADRLLRLEGLHALFDALVQRGSHCLPSTSNGAAPRIPIASSPTPPDSTNALHPSPPPPTAYLVASSSSSAPTASRAGTSTDRVSRDDSYVKKAKAAMWDDGITGLPISHVSAAAPAAVAVDLNSGGEKEKLSLIRLASMIEVAAKKGSRDLNFQGRLMDQIEWLPDSIGKLTGLVTLDISENRIAALPAAIGSLSSLAKLDLHSNRIAQLPDSIGDLCSLLCLDLRGNQLASLPSAIGRLVNLEELDVSSNHLTSLPDSIGSLIRLRKLIIETNNIDELPYTIGHCVSLAELRADYNRLKALPEAIGKLESLEILSVRYNNIRGLPTTMASLPKLKEVDISFNELEALPENFCLVTSLVKLNVGNNFADLRSLPRSIGNLEMLEELDISNNQIRVLPDSFGKLLQLRVLRVEENPLELPPREIAEKGAQAVVQYMAEHVAKREARSQPMKTKKTWAQFCFFSRPNKRKHDRLDNGT